MVLEEVVVIAVVALIVLYTGGWAWLRTQLGKLGLDGQKVADDMVAIEKKVIDVKDGVKKASDDIHLLIDNWVTLCKQPDIFNDEESIKAMNVLKNKILSTVMPKPAAKG